MWLILSPPSTYKNPIGTLLYSILKLRSNYMYNDEYTMFSLHRSNKRLLKGFFKNAKVILQDNGEIHVTHKIGGIYDKWNVVKKAEKNGLIQKGRVPFSKADYPGYCNKRAHGWFPDGEFHIGACSTFIFGVKEACSRIRNTT